MNIENKKNFKTKGLLKKKPMTAKLKGRKRRKLFLLVPMSLSFLGAVNYQRTSDKNLVENFYKSHFTKTAKKENLSELKSVESYSFLRVKRAFNQKVDLWRVDEFHTNEVESLILEAVDTKYLRERLELYLVQTLELSKQYQIDPFWVLSIMWTESHFNPKASSPVRAYGLMQIMPATKRYLIQKMAQEQNRSLADLFKRGKTVEGNIEMGIYYLKQLLVQFNYNYILATCAYNMGPGWVIKSLKFNKPVGVKNQYLDKVKKAYKEISRPYIVKSNAKKSPYRQSYAYKYRETKLKIDEFEKKFALFPYGFDEEMAFNQNIFDAAELSKNDRSKKIKMRSKIMGPIIL